MDLIRIAYVGSSIYGAFYNIKYYYRVVPGGRLPFNIRRPRMAVLVLFPIPKANPPPVMAGAVGAPPNPAPAGADGGAPKPPGAAPNPVGAPKPEGAAGGAPKPPPAPPVVAPNPAPPKVCGAVAAGVGAAAAGAPKVNPGVGVGAPPKGCDGVGTAAGAAAGGAPNPPNPVEAGTAGAGAEVLPAPKAKAGLGAPKPLDVVLVVAATAAPLPKEKAGPLDGGAGVAVVVVAAAVLVEDALPKEKAGAGGDVVIPIFRFLESFSMELSFILLLLFPDPNVKAGAGGDVDMPILRFLESFSMELPSLLLLLDPKVKAGVAAVVGAGAGVPEDPKVKAGLGAAGVGALVVVAAPPNVVDGVVVVALAGAIPNLGLLFVLSEDGGLADDESPKVNAGLGAAVVEVEAAVSVVLELAPKVKAAVGAGEEVLVLVGAPN